MRTEGKTGQAATVGKKNQSWSCSFVKQIKDDTEFLIRIHAELTSANYQTTAAPIGTVKFSCRRCYAGCLIVAYHQAFLGFNPASGS